MCVSAVWTGGVSEQYAAKVADLALGVRSGGRLGHQPQELHLHVSLRGCLHVILPSNRTHCLLSQKKQEFHMCKKYIWRHVSTFTLVSYVVQEVSRLFPVIYVITYFKC